MRIICTVKLNNYDFIFMASMFLETKTNKDITENYGINVFGNKDK